MRCDTCRKDSPVVMRVVVAKDYNRLLARAVYNCPSCFDRKEQTKPYAQAAHEPGRRGTRRPHGLVHEPGDRPEHPEKQPETDQPELRRHLQQRVVGVQRRMLPLESLARFHGVVRHTERP